jgi:fatty acid synthase subunit alpha
MDSNFFSSRLDSLLTICSHQFCSPVRWTETQQLLLGEFQTRKTVEVGPAETLTNMMKRTRDLVYRPYDTANNISREFLSVKKNRDDVYFAGAGGNSKTRAEKVPTPRPAAKVPAATAPPQSSQTTASTATPAPAPAAVSPQSASAPVVAAGPIDDTPVTAIEVVTTIVSLALKKPAKDIALDQSIKALSGGKPGT